MGTYGKRKQNKSVAWEPMEHLRKTNVLRWNHMKTHGKHKCCIGTYGKRKEIISFVWKQIENVWKTHVVRGNLLKTIENTSTRTCLKVKHIGGTGYLL